MKAPILVISDDVDLFRSVKEAEQYLEPPEVRAGVTVLDADGRPIRAVVTTQLMADVVKLEEEINAASDIPTLRAGLIRLIAANRRVAEGALKDLSLEELLNQGLEHLTD